MRQRKQQKNPQISLAPLPLRAVNAAQRYPMYTFYIAIYITTSLSYSERHLFMSKERGEEADNLQKFATVAAELYFLHFSIFCNQKFWS